MTLPRPVHALLREPMLHFLVLGAAIFLAYGFLSDPPATKEKAARVIEITPAIRERLAAQFAATWGRAPSPEEMATLVDTAVREEVLYREALELGLDRDDTVLRQRMVLKMELIGEGLAASLQPTDAELSDWYAENADRLAPPGRVAFEQVLLARPDDAGAVLSTLKAGGDPAALTAGSMLPTSLEASQPEIDGLFGRGFFASVLALPPGEWAGPVTSGYGSHLVRSRRSEIPPAPSLAEVRDKAVDLWRQDRAAALREAQYKDLRDRYEIRISTPDADG